MSAKAIKGLTHAYARDFRTPDEVREYVRGVCPDMLDGLDKSIAESDAVVYKALSGNRTKQAIHFERPHHIAEHHMLHMVREHEHCVRKAGANLHFAYKNSYLKKDLISILRGTGGRHGETRNEQLVTLGMKLGLSGEELAEHDNERLAGHIMRWVDRLSADDLAFVCNKSLLVRKYRTAVAKADTTLCFRINAAHADVKRFANDHKEGRDPRNGGTELPAMIDLNRIIMDINAEKKKKKSDRADRSRASRTLHSDSDTDSEEEETDEPHHFMGRPPSAIERYRNHDVLELMSRLQLVEEKPLIALHNCIAVRPGGDIGKKETLEMAHGAWLSAITSTLLDLAQKTERNEYARAVLSSHIHWAITNETTLNTGAIKDPMINAARFVEEVLHRLQLRLVGHEEESILTSAIGTMAMAKALQALVDAIIMFDAACHEQAKMDEGNVILAMKARESHLVGYPLLDTIPYLSREHLWDGALVAYPRVHGHDDEE